MHLLRTRPYVPGKLLWAALTAKLTPILGIDNYTGVGNFLKETMRFGYLYPCIDEQPLLPKYTEEGLMFGDLSQNIFEKKFISSITSAAIDPDSLSAEEGMLHMVEFISPYNIDNGKPTLLKGLLWIKESSTDSFSIVMKNNQAFIKYKTMEVSFRDKIANRFQIGGEKKYGFGLLELKEGPEKLNNKKLDGFPGEWCENDTDVYLKLNSNSPIWSHVSYSDNLSIKGNIEPLVGRDWQASKGAGRELTHYGLYWSPGSIFTETKTFKITMFGHWNCCTS
jgi:hypothetical protein